MLSPPKCQKSRHYFLVLPFLVVLCVTRTTHACMCIETTLEESFDRADAVFVGKVVHAVHGLPFSHSDYVFEVSESWKGVNDTKVPLRLRSTLIAPGFCSYPFFAGRTYVVYAYKDPDGILVGHAGQCTKTKLLKRSTESIAYLSNLPPLTLSKSPRNYRLMAWDFVRRGILMCTIYYLWRTRRYRKSESRPLLRRTVFSTRCIVIYLGIAMLASEPILASKYIPIDIIFYAISGFAPAMMLFYILPVYLILFGWIFVQGIKLVFENN